MPALWAGLTRHGAAQASSARHTILAAPRNSQLGPGVRVILQKGRGNAGPYVSLLEEPRALYPLAGHCRGSIPGVRNSGAMRSVRILVVDDYDDWRRLICSILATRPDFEVIGEAVNGQDAVQKAHALQPDLILLDIGLPILNGIEAAQRIREVSRESRVLVISETRLAEIAEEAFRSGVAGYVVKSGAGSELLNAVEAVLRGKRFISALLSGSAQES